ncbi:hypothetical protein D3C84_788710 [compost metagenome]
MLPSAHLRIDLPVWLKSLDIKASAWAQVVSQFNVHSSCSGRPSRMNCITRLLVPRSILVMSAVLSRKAFSDCLFRVARALSEPSYLLRNCNEPVYGVGIASQPSLLSPVLNLSTGAK